LHDYAELPDWTRPTMAACDAGFASHVRIVGGTIQQQSAATAPRWPRPPSASPPTARLVVSGNAH
jgi:hypothetical protein